MPLVSRNFDQIIDFTRTSAATFVGSNGLIQTTPASVNLLTYTQEFDNAAWTKSSATIAANSDVAPDGTSTADTITASGANGTALQSFTASAVAYTFSVWLRRLTGTGNVQITVDGTTYVTVAVTTTWTRFETTLTPSAGTRTAGIRIVTSADAVYAWGAQLQTGSSATTYTRNFGGLYPPRFNYDPVTLAPRGLQVEEQRTNLLTGSADFTATYWPIATNIVVTADNAVSPDGTSNADLIADNTTAGVQHRLYRDYTFTAQAHTLSVYAKRNTHRWMRLLAFDGTNTFFANFDLQSGAVGAKHASATSAITDCGGGWYRCAMTATTLAAAGNVQIVMLDSDGATSPWLYTGTGTSFWAFGAQLEAGAFRTSYIPTVASQVTRTRDDATIQAPNFAPWYNQSEGTFYVEFTPDTNVTANTIRLLTVSQAGAAARVVDIHTGTTTWQSYNGTTNVVGGTASVTSTTQKIATAYRSGSYALCLNGGTVGTASSSTVNSPTLMTIGSFSNSTQHMNGHMRSIRFYPTRLTDAQLQALTA